MHGQTYSTIESCIVYMGLSVGLKTNMQNKRSCIAPDDSGVQQLQDMHNAYLTSAIPSSLPLLKLRAFSIVVAAIACRASLVKNA